jgi:hypothetical protein
MSILDSGFRWFLFALLIPALCGSAPVVPPTVDMVWSKRTYQVTVPPPFGDVQVTISIGPAERVTGLEVWVADDRVEVPAEVYADIFSPGDIDIAYSDPTQTQSESVEYFVLAFEVGESYGIEYGADIDGCEPPCFDMVRDIIQIQVHADLSLQSRLSSLRYLGTDGQ